MSTSPPSLPGGDAGRRRTWEVAAAVPLALLGVAFIVAYSVLVLAVDLPGWVATILSVLLVITWCAYFVDLLVRVGLTPRGERTRFLIRHPVDVLSVIVPLFRAFHVVGLARKLPYFHHRSGTAVRAQVATVAAVYALLFVYFIALATLQVERAAPGATITDFGTAMWWACVTIATVGYGDTYPVTDLGRVYAVVLMGGGIVIVGASTALVISYITDRIHRLDRHDHDQ